MQFEVDDDIASRIVRDLDPCGTTFRSKPVATQLASLAPYLEEQDRRNRRRLGRDYFVSPPLIEVSHG